MGLSERVGVKEFDCVKVGVGVGGGVTVKVSDRLPVSGCVMVVECVLPERVGEMLKLSLGDRLRLTLAVGVRDALGLRLSVMVGLSVVVGDDVGGGLSVSVKVDEAVRGGDTEAVRVKLRLRLTVGLGVKLCVALKLRELLAL